MLTAHLLSGLTDDEIELILAEELQLLDAVT